MTSSRNPTRTSRPLYWPHPHTEASSAESFRRRKYNVVFYSALLVKRLTSSPTESRAAHSISTWSKSMATAFRAGVVDRCAMLIRLVCRESSRESQSSRRMIPPRGHCHRYCRKCLIKTKYLPISTWTDRRARHGIHSLRSYIANPSNHTTIML